MTDSTKSEISRKKGNLEFEKSKRFGKETDEAITKTIRSLKSAINWYEEALTGVGTTDGDVASAAKNYVKSCMEIVKVQLIINKHKRTTKRDNDNDDYIKEVIKYYTMALEKSLIALRHGVKSKGRNWSKDMQKTSRDVISRTTIFLQSVDYNGEIAGLPTCLKALVACLLELSSQMIDCEHSDNVLGMIREYNEPFEKLCDQPPVGSDIQELKSEMINAMRRAEGYKEFIAGKNQFTKMIDGDDLNVENMYVSIDCFNAAINTINGLDIKLEAMACSYLGQLYYKALHNVDRASECLNKCMLFVESLCLENLQTLYWYKACTETLAILEREMDKQDRPFSIQMVKEGTSQESEQDEEKIRTPADARERYPDDLEFMDYVHRHFPPRLKKPFKMPDTREMKAMTTAQLQKFLPKLIFAYHPDKARGQDEHWKDICTDICAGLNGILVTVRRGL